MGEQNNTKMQNDLKLKCLGKKPSVPLLNCKHKEVLVLKAITRYTWLGESPLGSKVIMDPKINLSNMPYD